MSVIMNSIYEFLLRQKNFFISFLYAIRSRPFTGLGLVVSQKFRIFVLSKILYLCV